MSLGPIAGLIASSSIMFYWLYSLGASMARKGWKCTSYFSSPPWIAVFLASLSGLLRISGVMRLGNVIYVALLYACAIVIYVALVVLVAGMLLDAMMKARRA